MIAKKRGLLKSSATTRASIAAGEPAPGVPVDPAATVTNNNYYYDAPPDWGWSTGPVFWQTGRGDRGGGGHGHGGHGHGGGHGGHHGGHH